MVILTLRCAAKGTPIGQPALVCGRGSDDRAQLADGLRRLVGEMPIRPLEHPSPRQQHGRNQDQSPAASILSVFGEQVADHDWSRLLELKSKEDWVFVYPAGRKSKISVQVVQVAASWNSRHGQFKVSRKPSSIDCFRSVSACLRASL